MFPQDCGKVGLELKKIHTDLRGGEGSTAVHNAHTGFDWNTWCADFTSFSVVVSLKNIIYLSFIAARRLTMEKKNQYYSMEKIGGFCWRKS